MGLDKFVAKAEILVVDDEVMICELLELALTASLYKVRSAYSGNQGYEMALKYRPQLIITDLRMNQGTGSELILKLKEKIPDYRPYLILISGHVDLDTKERERLGVHRFISKPFPTKVIIQAVNELLNI